MKDHDDERITAWRRYGYEQRRGDADRLPAYLRKPQPPLQQLPRSFSLGDLDPRSIKLQGDARGIDGFSLGCIAAICFAMGVIFSRILQGFF